MVFTWTDGHTPLWITPKSGERGAENGAPETWGHPCPGRKAGTGNGERGTGDGERGTGNRGRGARGEETAKTADGGRRPGFGIRGPGTRLRSGKPEYVFSAAAFLPSPRRGRGGGGEGARAGPPRTRPSATRSRKGRGNNAKHVQAGTTAGRPAQVEDSTGRAGKPGLLTRAMRALAAAHRRRPVRAGVLAHRAVSGNKWYCVPGNPARALSFTGPVS